MPKLHALELLPDDAGQELVRRTWQVLRDAGLPSQLDHRGRTNAPHLTVVSAAELPDEAIDVAAVRLGNLLPVRARVAGLLLLGGERVTLAHAVHLDDDVVRRVLAVRVQVPGRHHTGWLPHVTLARGLSRRDALRAVEALGQVDARPASTELTFTELRRWDPDRDRVTTVAQSGYRG